jgi:hypothetical protein
MTISSISLVNVGTTPNDGTGATIRAAFQTQNNNWSYISSYSINTVANNAVLSANTGVRKFVANGTGIFSNVWINLPVSSADAQEMIITSLVPIASCWVNQNGQSIQWLGNTFFANGNASARITFTTTNNRWMTF